MELLFKKEDTYSLRGICMLMIILSHTASSVEPTAFGFLPQALVARFGYLGTAVFFFLSGYGLLNSLVKSEMRMVAWFMKHVRKLLLPFLFTAAIYALMMAVGLIDIECNLLTNLLTLSLPTADLWFYKVILSIYLLSFIVFLLRISSETKVCIVAICTVVYYIFARCSGWDGWWWNSVLNFPLGMILALYIKRRGTVRLSMKIFVTAEMLTLAIFMLFMSKDSTVTSIAFTMFMVLAIHLVPLRSQILHYIGTNSIFFYLLEIPAMDIRPALMPTGNYITYSLLILVIVTLITLAYTTIEKLIQNKQFVG